MTNRKLFLTITFAFFTLLFAQPSESTIKNKQIRDIDLYNYRRTAIVQFPSKILEVATENSNFSPEILRHKDKYILIGSKAKFNNQLFYILTEEKAYYYYISTSYNESYPVILEIDE